MNSELYYLIQGLYNPEFTEVGNLWTGSTAKDFLKLCKIEILFFICAFTGVDENIFLGRILKEL